MRSYRIAVLVAGGLAAAFAAPSRAAGQPAAARAAAPAEAPVAAEARAFMEAYGRELAAGDRAAIAARYDRRGAFHLGGGRKFFGTFEEIGRHYASERWRPPAAFEWRDLSFEPAGPDAVVVAGRFAWTMREGEAPRLYSYTGLLVRQGGALRIRLEDEDGEPQPTSAPE
jgi:hypothetical protein